MKADWQGEIILCRRGLSFASSSLDMILYTTLHKLMGRKLFINVGLVVFGMRTMSELLASLGKYLLVKKDMTASVTASPTIGLNSL